MVNFLPNKWEVKEMLDEICPVQFVEGLNEGAESSEEGTIRITQFSGFGVQYIPSLSYSLTRLEIMFTFGDIPEGAEIRVDLCSDYDEKPSDIVLSSGSFPPKTPYAGWREVMLKPISVIRNRKYWVTIHPNRCPVALIEADKGQGYILSGKRDTRWKTPSVDNVLVEKGKVMLRFYGRVLPISTS